MRAVLISIQPKWCEKIASGEKTIEVRKTRPKIKTPFKCYIYCTKGKEREQTCFGQYTCHIGNGKVIGEFVCDRIAGNGETIRGNACLSEEELIDYCNGKDLYFWYISDLKIYDKPKELSEFYSIAKKRSDCCVGCIFHEMPNYEMPCVKCFGDRKYLIRPPQSWCYVED